MDQFEFHAITDSNHGAWTTLDPGVTQLTLNQDPTTGRRTLLQKWIAGGANSQTHPFTHDYVEEIYIVEGDLYDTKLKQGWKKGAYAYRKPGMEHGPFVSEGGCLMFIVCIPVDEKGDEMREA